MHTKAPLQPILFTLKASEDLNSFMYLKIKYYNFKEFFNKDAVMEK